MHQCALDTWGRGEERGANVLCAVGQWSVRVQRERGSRRVEAEVGVRADKERRTAACAMECDRENRGLSPQHTEK